MRAADRELLLDLFGGLGHPLASRCAVELAGSPRFGAFLERYRGKIGRKVRSLEKPERWPDLWLELWTAARLLADRRFEVAYESFGARKVRGPDLTLTFRTHTICHVEIKHVHTELSFAKWAEIVCTKLGQLPAGATSVLLVGTGPEIAKSCPAETALRELGRRAQQGETRYLHTLRPAGSTGLLPPDSAPGRSAPRRQLGSDRSGSARTSGRISRPGTGCLRIWPARSWPVSPHLPTRHNPRPGHQGVDSTAATRA